MVMIMNGNLGIHYQSPTRNILEIQCMENRRADIFPPPALTSPDMTQPADKTNSINARQQ
jgi:hypothetical protein